MKDILYSKLRLEVPSSLDGRNATITSSKGASRTVQMTAPITDIMVPGMDKYRVQAGYTNKDVSFGYGQIKKVEAKNQKIMHKLILSDRNYYGVNRFFVHKGTVYQIGNSGIAKLVETQWERDDTAFNSIRGYNKVFFTIGDNVYYTNGQFIYKFDFDANMWTQSGTFTDYVTNVVWLGSNGTYAFFSCNYQSSSTSVYTYCKVYAVNTNGVATQIWERIYSNVSGYINKAGGIHGNTVYVAVSGGNTTHELYGLTYTGGSSASATRIYSNPSGSYPYAQNVLFYENGYIYYISRSIYRQSELSLSSGFSNYKAITGGTYDGSFVVSLDWSDNVNDYKLIIGTEGTDNVVLFRNGSGTLITA